MHNKVVVIIIPTYNEALVIEETLRQVFHSTDQIPSMIFRVLIFDSGSTDNTQTIVKQLQSTNKNIYLRTEQVKSGLGSAYMKAMRIALDELSADIIIEFDADLSHDPKYIAPMLEKLDHCDVVIGSRYVHGGEIPSNWGWYRKLLSKWGNLIARLMLTTKYKDFTSGFRAIRQETLKQALPEHFISNDYAYKLHLMWSLHIHNAQIYEHPIVFVDRKKGRSKLPNNSIFDAIRVMIILRFRDLKRYFKMCMIGAMGLFIQCLVYNILRHKIPSFNASQWAVIAAMIHNFTFNNFFNFKNKLSSRFVSSYFKLSYSGGFSKQAAMQNGIFGKTITQVKYIPKFLQNSILKELKYTLLTCLQKSKSIVLFFAYSLLMVGIQSYSLQFMLNKLGSGMIKENIFIVSFAILASILNYLTYSHLVWGEGRHR